MAEGVVYLKQHVGGILRSVAYLSDDGTAKGNLTPLVHDEDEGGSGGGGLTDAELRASPVPVSGTLSVNGPLTDAELRASPVPVSGTLSVNGPLTSAQLATAGLATAANQDDILAALGSILTELQTANTHLAAIADNTSAE